MFLTKKEVSERLDICMSALERLMRNGDIPYYRMSARLIKFDERDVDAYIRSCRREGYSRPTGEAGGRLVWKPGMKVV